MKKDHDLALKALEGEGSELDDEEIAMVAHRVTKLLKKDGWQLKKGSSSKARNSDHDKVSDCFKCGKHDHVVKNYPLQNEEQGSKQFRNYAKRLQQNFSTKHFTKAMMASWGETSEDEEDSQEEETAVALIAGSESESKAENLFQLKEKVRRASKPKPEKLLFTLFDDFEEINVESCMFKDICSELKKDIRLLEKNKQELDHLK